MNNHQTWFCKIGVRGRPQLPPGSDLSMRQDIQRAFREVTGVDAEFIFSGWNASLDDIEAEIVDGKDKVLEDLDTSK